MKALLASRIIELSRADQSNPQGEDLITFTIQDLPEKIKPDPKLTHGLKTYSEKLKEEIGQYEPAFYFARQNLTRLNNLDWITNS
jgi:hypothetical protein